MIDQLTLKRTITVSHPLTAPDAERIGAEACRAFFGDRSHRFTVDVSPSMQRVDGTVISWEIDVWGEATT